ncbi:polymer-forming cytoskeletal protein [Rhizobium sp. MHM7A]|uniref:polymer-forming cytoskeletal protein n=1 Tax=Rhizobium sp. MHM7A TaxID=2583233 RepID=UPI001105B68D|nr:polymer-forming cytoskeletal protein [Rhizobium sp. MHM7A]TLX17002.1 hypothetical protein FFR93_06690 [Rhizobium sp. MHM7A]
MTTVLDIEHQLDGEIIVRDQHVGDIRCKKLTITRSGSVKGNILCKHLQIGGYVEGIAVCHVLEGNTQGTLHGSLYYVTKKDEAKVAGIVDYREPPVSVWAVVMPEAIDVPALSSADEFDVATEEAFADAVEEFVQEIASEPVVDTLVSTDAVVVADSIAAEETATGDEVGFAAPVPSSHPVEVSGTSSKFFPTPVEVVEALQKPVETAPAVAWVSTGRKVPLGARFF